MKSCVFVLVLAVALCAAEIVDQAQPGQTKMLSCGITGASKWLRGGSLLLSEDPRTGMPLKGKGEIVQRSRIKQGRHLEISKITPQDAGLFTCSGNGKEEHHRLVVSSASVSSPSGRLEVGSGATLQCEVSGLPQGATVEWVGPGGKRQRTPRLQLTLALADAGLWECVFSVGGKTLKENVTVQVTEPGSKTTAAPSTTRTTERANVSTCPGCDVVSTHVPVEEGLLGLSWWVWAAVGGGCLVVLLWVLILVMYNRMTRRRRRFMKMRNADLLRPREYCRCPGGPTAAAGQRGKKTSAPPITAAPVYAAP